MKVGAGQLWWQEALLRFSRPGKRWWWLGLEYQCRWWASWISNFVRCYVPYGWKCPGETGEIRNIFCELCFYHMVYKVSLTPTFCTVRLDPVLCRICLVYLFLWPLHPVNLKGIDSEKDKANWAGLANYLSFSGSWDPNVVGCTAKVNGPPCMTFILLIYVESQSSKP